MREFESASGCLGENSEAGLKLLAILSAEAESRVVVQKNSVVTVLIGPQAADAIEVNDGRPVDATEQRRVEVPLEIRQAATEQMRACAEVQRRIIVGSFDPVDLGERDKSDLARGLDGETIELARVVFAKFDLLLCT